MGVGHRTVLLSSTLRHVGHMEEARLVSRWVQQCRLHRVPLCKELAEQQLGTVLIAGVRTLRALLITILVADVLDLRATHVHHLYGAVVSHTTHHLHETRALRHLPLQFLAVNITDSLHGCSTD